MISSYAIIILHKDFFVIYLTNLSLSSTWLSLPGYFLSGKQNQPDYTRILTVDTYQEVFPEIQNPYYSARYLWSPLRFRKQKKNHLMVSA